MMAIGLPVSTRVGPTVMPISIACRSMKVVRCLAPQSRTVVTPAYRCALALRADCSASTSSGRVVRSSPARPSPIPLRWTWQSTRPGRTVLPS